MTNTDPAFFSPGFLRTVFFFLEEPADWANRSQAAIIKEPAADWLNTLQQITNELDFVYKHGGSQHNKKIFKVCLLLADGNNQSAVSKQCAVVQILEITIKICIFVLK